MMGPRPEDIGVGATDDLSLRVSAAALARVVFRPPGGGAKLLALEHKATVTPGSRPPTLTVRAQPFGGAVRLRNIENFLRAVDSFRFDSHRSRDERDLRVFVRPSSLKAVQAFCLSRGTDEPDADLESDPSRELREEFEDAVGVEVELTMYSMTRVGIVLENEPLPTNNVRAPGKLTARIYWIYDVEVKDAGLCQALLASSRTWRAEVLGRKALDAYARGKPGWANAALVVPLDSVRHAYLSAVPEHRGGPITFQGASLAGNVPVILDGIDVPKYERHPQSPLSGR